MKKLFFLLLFFSQSIAAQDLARMTIHEKGQPPKVVYYDNTYPQCVSLTFFIQNTISDYKSAYTGHASLKKADENVSNRIIDTLNTVNSKNLPLPFSSNVLLNHASSIKTMIFSGKNENLENYSSTAYNDCVNTLIANGYEGHTNKTYDQKIDYSKGEDKLAIEKITQISQLCDHAEFPQFLQKARLQITESAKSRGYSIEEFIRKSGYSSINIMAEKLLQGQLDGKIPQQFLYEVYLKTTLKSPPKVTDRICPNLN